MLCTSQAALLIHNCNENVQFFYIFRFCPFCFDVSFKQTFLIYGKTRFVSLRLKKCVTWPLGIEADSEKLKKVIGELNGKSVEDLMAQGREKLSSMPAGGAAPAAAAAAAPAAAAAEEKKEEKEAKKEESESDDEDMGFGLFD
ncbi:unnamed protein product, partial [Brenthis ino]